MNFNKIVSISTVYITKSDLIKYDLKKYLKINNFEIWDLGSYFYKNKKKYLKINNNLKINYLKKFSSYEKIKKNIKMLGENDLIVDPFNISNNSVFSNIIKINKIKILQYQLSPIPVLSRKFNIFFFAHKFISSPKYYLNRIIYSRISYLYPDYLMVVNQNYINETNYRISKKTKIITAHSFDYVRSQSLNRSINLVLPKKFAVFLDEGVTGHPDYEYLDVNHFCNTNVYFTEIKNFFKFFEHKFNLQIVIAAHPKIKYRIKNNFNRKIYFDNTINLVKKSKLVFSHMSTSINFAVIFKKPIIFLNSKNYTSQFSNQINFHSKVLNSRLINLSNENWNITNIPKYNINSYDRYLNKYITLNKNDKRNSWKILSDNIT